MWDGSHLAANPHVDETLSLDKRSLAAQWRVLSYLRRRRFDTVIDLTDADRSAFLTWISGAPVRIGFNDEQRWRGRCYTVVVKAHSPDHRIERDLASLTPLGILAGDSRPRLWLTPERRTTGRRAVRSTRAWRASSNDDGSPAWCALLV